MNSWKKLSTRKFAGNDHWEYYIDDFQLDEHTIREYHYVHTEGSTMVIPLLPDNTMVMVKQYRYLNKKFSLEFPCGAVQKGLSILENVQKELREETGYRSELLQKLAEFTPYTGAADETCHVFLAENLVIDPLPPDDTEQIELVKLTYSQLESMIQQNSIWDGLTLAAWSLVNKTLQEKLHA